MMEGVIMRRLILTAVTAAALTVPGTLVLAGVSAPAGAATYSVSCSKASGTLTQITFTNCSPKNSQYKTLTVKPAQDATGGLLPWSPSGKTTNVAKVSIATTGTCPSGSEAFVVSTTVVSGGTATYTKVGDEAVFPLCKSASGAITLQKGLDALI